MGKKLGEIRLLASELEILQTLWSGDGLTIVEVQRRLSKSAGYTTVQTRLNRMVQKGFVKRSRQTPSRYSAAVSQEEATSVDLNMLLNRVSQGQVLPLVAQLLGDRSLSEEEYAELRQLIDDAEQRSRSLRG